MRLGGVRPVNGGSCLERCVRGDGENKVGRQRQWVRHASLARRENEILAGVQCCLKGRRVVLVGVVALDAFGGDLTLAAGDGGSSSDYDAGQEGERSAKHYVFVIGKFSQASIWHIMAHKLCERSKVRSASELNPGGIHDGGLPSW